MTIFRALYSPQRKIWTDYSIPAYYFQPTYADRAVSSGAALSEKAVLLLGELFTEKNNKNTKSNCCLSAHQT